MSKEIPVPGLEVVRKYLDTGQEVRMGYVLSVNLETGRVTCMEANGSVVSLGDFQEDFAGVNCQVFMRPTQPEGGALAEMFDEQEPTVTILKGDIGDFLDPTGELREDLGEPGTARVTNPPGADFTLPGMEVGHFIDADVPASAAEDDEPAVMGRSGYPMDTITANEPKIPGSNPYALPGHRRLESIGEGEVRDHLHHFNNDTLEGNPTQPWHLRMEHGVSLAVDTHPDEVNAQHEALHALDVLAPDKTASSDPVWGIGVSPGAAVPFNGTLWEAMNEVNRRRDNGDNVHLFQRVDHGWARTTAHHERNIDPVVNLAESVAAQQGDDVRCVPGKGHFVRASNKQELAQATYPMACDCGLLVLLTVSLRDPGEGMN